MSVIVTKDTAIQKPAEKKAGSGKDSKKRKQKDDSDGDMSRDPELV